MIGPMGRTIDATSPMVDSRLLDGSRINAVIPPLSTKGPVVTIRKFKESMTNIDELIIIAINVDIPIDSLLKENFKACTCNLHSTSNLRNVLFVLKKRYLPYLSYREPNSEDIKKEQLQLINENINLYTSIIDLNLPENKHLKDEWKINDNENKVQVTIAFHAIIHWKKEREIIQFNISSQYKEQGVENEVDDIIALK